MSLVLPALADPCSTAASGPATTNISTRYGFDPEGNLVSMIDGNGQLTT